MSPSHPKRLAVRFAFIMLFVLVVGGVVLAKKPPKDPPPEPDPAPVEYQLTWADGGDASFEAITIQGMNDQGVAVGRVFWTYYSGPQTAFRWSSATGLQHLDDLSNVWIDLNIDSPVSGWRTSSAWDINESGQIVGTAVKDGEDTRSFLFDDVGFYLLPTTEGVGPYRARCISDSGNVLGTYDATWTFFWSPLNPSTLALFAYDRDIPRHPGPGSRMNDNYIALQLLTDYDYEVYSYSVDSDGALVYQLDSDLPMAHRLGDLSSTNLMAFTGVQRKRKYFVGVYDADTGESVQVASGTHEYASSLAINDSGDVIYKGTDRIPQLYRNLEDSSSKIYDLLSPTAKTELADYGELARFIINSSNVGDAPVADPFDHIVGEGTWPGTYFPRAFILTPVPKSN